MENGDRTSTPAGWGEAQKFWAGLVVVVLGAAFVLVIVAILVAPLFGR